MIPVNNANYEGWEEKRLDQIGQIFSGATPSTSVGSLWDGDIVWVTPADLSQQNNQYIGKSQRTITQSGLESCAAQLVPEGAIVLSSRAPIGYVAVASRPLATNQGCKSLVLGRGHIPEFHYYNLLFHIQKIKDKGEGTTFAEISKSALEKIIVPVPIDKNQQAKIAEVLSAVDRAIEQTDALTAKHQRVKAGLMQDLLTRGIDADGNLRDLATHAFKDSPLGPIPVEWEVQRVKDVCALGRGRVISQTYLEEHPGIYPVYSSQSKDGGIFGYIDSFDFDDEYVTWTTDGAYAGTVFYRSGKFNCTNVCGTLKAQPNKAYTTFLALYLSQIAKGFVSYVGNPKLMNGIMANIEIKLPSVDEQTAIAERLAAFDALLGEQSALRAKLTRQKRGLMQDLLTGKVPVSGLLAAI